MCLLHLVTRAPGACWRPEAGWGELCTASCRQHKCRHQKEQGLECGSLDVILTSDAQSSCEQTLPSRPQFYALSDEKNCVCITGLPGGLYLMSV